MEVARTLNWSARIGYAARGVVYLIVGVFAIFAAFGNGDAEDPQGALRSLLGHPLGEVLLGLLALGLLFFAGWRFIQAFGDPDGLGTGWGGIVLRGAMLASGLIHLALAGFAAGLLFEIGFQDGAGGDPTAGWLKWLFGKQWGRWVAMAIALVPIGIGIAHIYKGWTAGYEKYLKADADTMRVLKPICSFGLIARGVVFVAIGIVAIYGGGIYDAQDAPGLEDGLDWIRDLPFGWSAFLAVAVGLVAFAVYAFVEAVYRRIEVEEAG